MDTVRPIQTGWHGEACDDWGCFDRAEGHLPRRKQGSQMVSTEWITVIGMLSGRAIRRASAIASPCIASSLAPQEPVNSPYRRVMA